MSEQAKYVPILKAREAEIKALLRTPAGLAVTPLFELQPASVASIDRETGQPKRGKSAATDASYFLDDIARLWAESLYLDISRVSRDNQRSEWWRLIDSLSQLSSDPSWIVPVLRPGDLASTVSSTANIGKRAGRVAIRVSMPKWRASANALSGLPDKIAQQVGLPVESVDVIFDWEDQLESLTLDDAVRETVAIQASFSGAHGEIIAVGTPNSTLFQREGDWSPTRREWWLWLRLVEAGNPITYGDYALFAPANPAPVSPKYGHLRYSHSDQVHVHRRAIPRSGGGLGAAFGVCCEHLIGQDHWLGPEFSKADQRLYDIGSGTDKESTPAKWRQLAMEHHFALVEGQLADPPSAPPTGTS